jgi:hypothetical protein
VLMMLIYIGLKLTCYKEALVVASEETGLEVNGDKTKYTVMSRDQTAGQSHSMKSDNSYFERVEQFK